MIDNYRPTVKIVYEYPDNGSYTRQIQVVERTSSSTVITARGEVIEDDSE